MCDGIGENVAQFVMGLHGFMIVPDVGAVSERCAKGKYFPHSYAMFCMFSPISAV